MINGLAGTRNRADLRLPHEPNFDRLCAVYEEVENSPPSSGDVSPFLK
jgi:hypothetical protein